ELAPAAPELRVNLPADVSVTLTAAGLWIGSELWKDELAPAECRWCESNRVDSSVRDALVWKSSGHTAVIVSNAGAYVLAPVAALGLAALSAAHEGRARSNLLVDVLVIAEAAALAGDLGQLIKFSVGRQRPYAHAGLPNT